MNPLEGLASKEILNSLPLLQRVADGLPFGYGLVRVEEHDYRYLVLNDPAIYVQQQRAKDWIGKTGSERGSDIRYWLQPLKHVLITGEPWQHEFESYNDNDGSVVVYRTRFSLVDRDERLLQFTLENITELAESELSTHRLGQGLYRSSNYVWILDLERQVVFRNFLADNQLFLWQRSSLEQPESFADHFTDQDLIENAFTEAEAKGEKTIQTQMRTPEGYNMDVELTISHQPNPDPKKSCWMVTARDTRELNRTIRLQQTLIDRLQAAMEGANDGMWEYDFQTQTAYFSDRWKTMLGFAPHEFPNSTEAWVQRIHPDDSEKVLKKLREHYAGLTDDYRAEYRIKCKDGTYKRILARGKVQRGPSGDLRRFAGSHTDIDEMIRSLESSEYSLERFRSIANLMPVVVWTFNPEGETEFVNDKWCELVGIEPDDPRAADWRNFIPPEKLHSAISQFDRMVANRESYEIEYEMVAADGRRIWIWEVGRPRFASGGTFLGFVVVSVDITSEKSLRQKLERSEKKFRNLVDGAPFLVAILDGNCSIEYLNSAFRNFLAPQIELPAPMEHFVFPTDQSLFEECVASVNPETPLRFHNIRFKRLNGAYRELLVGVSIHDATASDMQYLLVGIDYESQRNTEAKVRRAERLLDLSQRVTKTGSLELDPQAGISWCSSAALALLGITDRSHFTSIQAIYERLEPADAHRLQQMVETTPLRGESDQTDCTITDSRGERRTLRATVTPVVLVPEHTERVLVTLQEVPSKEATAGTPGTSPPAGDDIGKAEFLSNIGYEIRSPINAILGHISHLKPRTQKEIVTLENISADAERLDRLVTDMLLYAQLVGNQQEIDARPFMVEETIEETCLYWSRKAFAKGLRSIFDTKLEADQQRIGDVSKMCLILDQLLENAVKYTHSGYIMMTIEAVDDNAAIRVSVEDSGVGMEPQVLANVFEAMNHEFGLKPFGSGSGLGLPIAHRTCQILGGELEIQSEPGKGTTARFTIPMALAPTRTKQNEANRKLGDGIHIGVFDPLPQGASAILRVFEFAGATGEISTKPVSVEPFDVIVLQPEFLPLIDWEAKRPDSLAVVFVNPGDAPQVPLTLDPAELLQVPKPIRRTDQMDILKAYCEFRPKSS